MCVSVWGARRGKVGWVYFCVTCNNINEVNRCGCNGQIMSEGSRCILQLNT